MDRMIIKGAVVVEFAKVRDDSRRMRMRMRYTVRLEKESGHVISTIPGNACWLFRAKIGSRDVYVVDLDHVLRKSGYSQWETSGLGRVVEECESMKGIASEYAFGQIRTIPGYGVYIDRNAPVYRLVKMVDVLDLFGDEEE